MWSTVILVCSAMTVTPDGCDTSNLTWSAQSGYVFQTEDQCHAGALFQFNSKRAEIRERMNDDEEYRVEMFCNEQKNEETQELPPNHPELPPVVMPKHR